MSKERSKTENLYIITFPIILESHVNIYDIIKAVTKFWLKYCAISGDLPHCKLVLPVQDVPFVANCKVVTASSMGSKVHLGQHSFPPTRVAADLELFEMKNSFIFRQFWLCISASILKCWNLLHLCDLFVLVG